jgi:hypothetical protein
MPTKRLNIVPVTNIFKRYRLSCQQLFIATKEPCVGSKAIASFFAGMVFTT